MYEIDAPGSVSKDCVGEGHHLGGVFGLDRVLVPPVAEAKVNHRIDVLGYETAQARDASPQRIKHVIELADAIRKRRSRSSNCSALEPNHFSRNIPLN